MLPSRALAFSLAIGSVALARGARADGVAARLVYVRSADAAQCPGPSDLERAVTKRLGYSPFFPWAPRTIVAEVRGQGRTLKARAELVDETGALLGSRELSGDAAQCNELVASLALTISITLDPMSLNRDPGEPTEDRADE